MRRLTSALKYFNILYSSCFERYILLWLLLAAIATIIVVRGVNLEALISDDHSSHLPLEPIRVRSFLQDLENTSASTFRRV
jgi:hypothetical protein